MRSLLPEWRRTVSPGQPNRSAWTVHAASPPPAARCYVNFGLLLIKPVSGEAHFRSTTAQAPMDVEPPPVVASPLPLLLREELGKHVSAIRQSLCAELAEVSTRLDKARRVWFESCQDFGAQVHEFKQSQTEVKSKLCDLSAELSGLDITAAVTSALACQLFTCSAATRAAQCSRSNHHSWACLRAAEPAAQEVQGRRALQCLCAGDALVARARDPCQRLAAHFYG